MYRACLLTLEGIQEHERVRLKKSEEILDSAAASRVSSLSRMKSEYLSSDSDSDDSVANGREFLQKTRELIKKE